MSLLLVKPGHSRGRSLPLHLAISHNAEIYTIQDLTDCIAYTPTHKLDDGEWFFIDNFNTTNFKDEFIDVQTVVPADYVQLSPNHFSSAKYLCVKEGDFKYYQKLVTSNYVRKKFFNVNDASFIPNGNIITLNDVPDAVYQISTNKLFFKDLSRISVIFTGIDSLYREATDHEVISFLQDDLIHVDNPANFKVGIPNRKKIALAHEKLASFGVNDRAVITKYIQSYYPEITYANNKFIIDDEIKLKNFIYGVEQRFYTTLVGNERRVASSVLTLK